MWRTIWNKIKEALGKMLGLQTIEQTIHVKPVISSEMENALELWYDMYQNNAPWLKVATEVDPVEVVSLNLPSMIANEKARMVTLEMQSTITTPTEEVEEENPDYTPPGIDENGLPILEKGTPTVVKEKPKGKTDRAEWMDKIYQDKVLKPLRTRQLEYGIALGGLVIKPYVTEKMITNEKSKKVESKLSIEVEFIKANAFYPLAFNDDGTITEAAFMQTKVTKEYTYRRIEHHKLEKDKVTVKNKAFRSKNNTTSNIHASELGDEIPLTEVPEWSKLQKEQTISNVDRLLFAYFKMPDANTVDLDSPLGVSGFNRAIDLIKQADLQYSRVLWEMQATEAAIDIDRDALTDVQNRDGTYHYKNPILQQRLFRFVDIGNTGETYNVYTPTIRDASLINVLNLNLMRIEDVCGLSRGTLSDPAGEARTATELKILKQRSYVTNANIQQALEDALKDVVYIMNTYATLYEIVPDGEYDVSFEWDDSILVDVEQELNKRLTLMNQGLASKLETRMWYFGETEAQAKEALQKIQADAMENMQQNLANQQALGNLQNAQNDEME